MDECLAKVNYYLDSHTITFQSDLQYEKILIHRLALDDFYIAEEEVSLSLRKEAI
jgi:hypothetical protein